MKLLACVGIDLAKACQKFADFMAKFTALMTGYQKSFNLYPWGKKAKPKVVLQQAMEMMPDLESVVSDGALPKQQLLEIAG